MRFHQKSKKTAIIIQHIFLFFMILASPIICSTNYAFADVSDTSFVIFAGQATENDVGDWINSNHTFQDSYQAGIGINHRLWKGGKSALEAEAMVMNHSGDQSYTELNAMLVFRWLRFPWDEHIDTSFAVGEGLSYADAIPDIERFYHTNTNRLLNFILLELEFSLRDSPGWGMVFRWHHRSGAFGLFNEVKGASDFLVWGLRYHY